MLEAEHDYFKSRRNNQEIKFVLKEDWLIGALESFSPVVLDLSEGFFLFIFLFEILIHTHTVCYIYLNLQINNN